MEDLHINEHLIIPAAELQAVYSRSSGPGGQNVNKVNSKVTLIWDLNESQSLLPSTRDRLRALAANRITEDGLLKITSQVHREQVRNIQVCREMLRRLILSAMKPPTIRKPSKPTKGSKIRRLNEKKSTADKKKGRGSRWDE